MSMQPFRMNIGILLSTLGGSPLQCGIERGLEELGHNVLPYREGQQYDLLLVFNQTAHVTSYRYPEFPKGSNLPMAFIDCAEYGYFKRLPEVADAYKNTFSKGSLDHDTKNKHEQLRLREFLEGRSFPYFLREYFKWMTFPGSYHPIDYPLYYQSLCQRVPSRDEYLGRDLDLFVSWGGSHPWRLPITQAMRDAHTKCEISVIGENGAIRLPQAQYFNGIERAKCSVSFDGYGSSSFRLTEVLVRSLLLRGPLSIVRHKDLCDGVHCLDYEVKTIGEHFVETNIGQKLREALDDPEKSYAMYQAGYHHCLDYYTEKATARYVLDMVNAHDWSQPTPLDL